MPDYTEGYVLVGYPKHMLDVDFQSAMQRLGHPSLGAVHPALRVHKLAVTPGEEVATIAKLRNDPNVEFAELDEVVRTTLTLNDPQIPAAFHLTRIGASVAWDRTAGAGVTVAVVDGGVQLNHPDLAANLVPGWDVVKNTTNGTDADGHGTAVAGIIAAVGNNSVMSAGIAYQAKLMPISAKDSAGNSTFSLVASAILAASDRGAKIVNISFSNLYKSSTVISAAQQFRTAKDGIVVCSANNNGIDENAGQSVQVVVSGTQADDTFWPTSSWGAMVDVCAPAYQVPTTLWNSGYGWGTGTSFATPIVAGVIALIKSVRPDLVATQVLKVLYDSAKDMGTTGYDTHYGYGRVDAALAVQNALIFGRALGSNNVALASAGAVATASSTYNANYPAGGVINGDRKGLNWGKGGGWNDGTANQWPDWLQVDFAASKTIDRVVIYSLQDKYGTPVEPTDAQTFTKYGVVDFVIQGWTDPTGWTPLATVTGNKLVKRTVTFAPVTTKAIRVSISRTKDAYSRLVEVEAWEAANP